jgi:hypothetical protein
MRLQIGIICHRGCEGCVAAAGGLIRISQRFARLSRGCVYRLSAGKACNLDAAKIRESLSRASQSLEVGDVRQMFAQQIWVGSQALGPWGG